jgi:hypothetical protein
LQAGGHRFDPGTLHLAFPAAPLSVYEIVIGIVFWPGWMLP